MEFANESPDDESLIAGDYESGGRVILPFMYGGGKRRYLPFERRRRKKIPHMTRSRICVRCAFHIRVDDSIIMYLGQRRRRRTGVQSLCDRRLFPFTPFSHSNLAHAVTAFHYEDYVLMMCEGRRERRRLSQCVTSRAHQHVMLL